MIYRINQQQQQQQQKKDKNELSTNWIFSVFQLKFFCFDKC